ncbi:ArsR/SmtB family transcription factor [Gordonia aichiensis]|uniref:ArsR/SmtB family transcription factor n=1 Tax=Gordonia aichiensis TaxID=36820 RepID=UPI003266D632
MNSWNSEAGDRVAVLDALADVLKAMANPRRLGLVEVLAQGEQSVDALARLSGIGVTSVSAHLQTLKRAGLVECRREGTTVFYRLAGDDVARLFVVAQQVGMKRSSHLRDEVGRYLGDPTTSVVGTAAIADDALVLDVRRAEEYAAGHFGGAVSIPADELPDRWRELPDDRPVVIYCRGELCRLARTSAQWLRERGFDATALADGVLEWRAEGEVDLERDADPRS